MLCSAVHSAHNYGEYKVKSVSVEGRIIENFIKPCAPHSLKKTKVTMIMMIVCPSRFHSSEFYGAFFVAFYTRAQFQFVHFNAKCNS